jgi:hypothetical protein
MTLNKEPGLFLGPAIYFAVVRQVLCAWKCKQCDTACKRIFEDVKVTGGDDWYVLDIHEFQDTISPAARNWNNLDFF